MKISTTRIIVAALIGTGVVAAAAVGVRYKYHFLKKDERGRHVVVTEDGRRSWVFSKKTAGNPQQAVETAEEMDLLIQQGKKELVSVHDTEVGGRLDNRKLLYRYTLSDGRTVDQVEDDPATGPGTLTKEQKEEARRLWENVLAGSKLIGISDGPHLTITAEGEEIPTDERVVQGRTFTFQKVSFTLADGTEVARSIGLLSEDRPNAATVRDGNAKDTGRTREDLREWISLRRQDKRQLVGVDELTANGELDRRVFVYRYQLSDGRTMDMRESAGGTPFLSTSQRQEWAGRKNAGSGQDIGTYEEEVMGRTFAFKRQQYVLSDGTELIWSFGKPKDGQ